jgi:cell division protein FtsL
MLFYLLIAVCACLAVYIYYNIAACRELEAECRMLEQQIEVVRQNIAKLKEIRQSLED